MNIITFNVNQKLIDTSLFTNEIEIPVFILKVHPDNVLFENDSMLSPFTITVDIEEGYIGILKPKTLVMKIDKGENKHFLIPVLNGGYVFRTVKQYYDILKKINK